MVTENIFQVFFRGFSQLKTTSTTIKWFAKACYCLLPVSSLERSRWSRGKYVHHENLFIYYLQCVHIHTITNGKCEISPQCCFSV